MVRNNVIDQSQISHLIIFENQTTVDSLNDFIKGFFEKFPTPRQTPVYAYLPMSRVKIEFPEFPEANGKYELVQVRESSGNLLVNFKSEFFLYHVELCITWHDDVCEANVTISKSFRQETYDVVDGEKRLMSVSNVYENVYESYD